MLEFQSQLCNNIIYKYIIKCMLFNFFPSKFYYYELYFYYYLLIWKIIKICLYYGKLITKLVE